MQKFFGGIFALLVLTACSQSNPQTVTLTGGATLTVYDSIAHGSGDLRAYSVSDSIAHGSGDLRSNGTIIVLTGTSTTQPTSASPTPSRNSSASGQTCRVNVIHDPSATPTVIRIVPNC